MQAMGIMSVYSQDSEGEISRPVSTVSGMVEAVDLLTRLVILKPAGTNEVLMITIAAARQKHIV